MGVARRDSGGAAYFYERVDTASPWTEAKKLIPPVPVAYSYFGAQVAAAGDLVVVGSAAFGDDQGRAYVFERDRGGAGNWGLVRELVGSRTRTRSQFGQDVAVFGDVIVVGASGAQNEPGEAYVFQRDAGGADNWGEVQILDPETSLGERFGESLAFESSTGTLVVGASGSPRTEQAVPGAAYVFRWEAAEFVQVAKLRGFDTEGADSFGAHVAIHQGLVIIGAHDDIVGDSLGSAYVFAEGLNGAWEQAAKFVPPIAGANEFGNSVALAGGVIIVGEHGNSERANSAGAVHVFENLGDDPMWAFAETLYAFDAAEDVGFGSDVALVGDELFVGAPYEDETAYSAGAVYFGHIARCP